MLPGVAAAALEALVGVVDVAPARRPDRGAVASSGRTTRIGSASSGHHRQLRGGCTRSAPVACRHPEGRSHRHHRPRRRCAPPTPVAGSGRRSSTPPRAAARAHAGVVHAPGGPQPARVPGACAARAAILDAIKQPELAAEITLQPVRRYGVDAAVLYSDIVVPAHAVGFGIDVHAGHRARRAGRRCAPPPTSTASARSTRRRHPVRARHRRCPGRRTAAGVPLLAFAGAPFTVASYLIEGRPSRTYEHTKAMMHADPQLWDGVMRRLADRAVASIERQLDHGARAFQLFDSGRARCRRADYDRFVLPHRRRCSRVSRPAPRRPRHPLRDRLRPPARVDARRRPRRDRPGLADPDRRGPAADRRRPRRAGQPRPGARPRRARGRAGRAPAPCSPTTAATRATCSTSATACSPSSDPDVLAAIVELVHAERPAR